MPRNTKGGNKAKRGKNAPATERALLLREEGQEYARVIARLGGRPPLLKVRILGRNGEPDREITAKIRGKLCKRVWMNPDDLILVGLRDFETAENMVDVFHKYKENEKWKLIKKGEIQAEEDEAPPEYEPVQKPKKKVSQSLANRMAPALDPGLLPSDDEADDDDQERAGGQAGNIKSLNEVPDDDDLPYDIDLADL